MSGTLVAPDPAVAAAWTDAGPRSRAYEIHGIRLRVTSDDATALSLVHDTYASFAVPDADGEWLDFALLHGDDERWILRTADGAKSDWPTASSGLIALFDRLVGTVIPTLHGTGIYAVHAGAVANEAGAIVIAGRSGQGKTTLVLGLLSRGFTLLSDELALVDPTSRRIMAYRRSVHVRPGTIALIPDLAVLEDRPRAELGGGSEWAVRPEEISSILGGGQAELPEAADVGAVLVLDGTPAANRAPLLAEISPAIAALELLRGTWAASVDFGGTLGAISEAIAGVPCARLTVGDLDATLDAVVAWRVPGDG